MSNETISRTKNIEFSFYNIRKREHTINKVENLKAKNSLWGTKSCLKIFSL